MTSNSNITHVSAHQRTYTLKLRQSSIGGYCMSTTKSPLLSPSGINSNCSQDASETQKGLLFRIWGQNKAGLYTAGSPPTAHLTSLHPPIPCATAGRPQNVYPWLSFILPLSPFATLQGPVGASGAKGDMVNKLKNRDRHSDSLHPAFCLQDAVLDLVSQSWCRNCQSFVWVARWL